MPTPDSQDSIEVVFTGGYFPSAAALSPSVLQSTIRRGNNAWLRPGGKLDVANGVAEVSATSVGARIFAADTQRASIAGNLVGSRLPFAGLLRYQNACLLFVSEETDAQVYLDEAAPTGLTTSSTAGRLRVGVPDGAGGFDTFDAGFDKPPLVAADLALFDSVGVKNMRGSVGVALSRWRTKTNAWGPPSDVLYSDITANTQTVVSFNLPSPAAGQDGWLVLGTLWNDSSGQVRVFRYVYLQPRGTYTATNGSPNISGLNTFWTQDLGRFDKVLLDDGNLYDILTNPTDDTATITPNYAGSTGSGKTMAMSAIRAEWFDGDLRDIIDRNIQRPPRAAGITLFRDRLVLWGIPDTNNATATEATGNGFGVMLNNNPEHLGTLARATASGSNILSALAADGPIYFMTTTSLEIIEPVSNGDQPFVPRVIAEPGFKAATNGCLYKDWFYGFNNKPLRTRARENIDVQFAAPVEGDMADWDAERVIVTQDPDNEAVLYIYDNGSTTTVRPWLAQQGVWNPPINLSARILDAQVVNGKLYVTYLDGSIKVNEWEGGNGLSDAYVSSQYYDARKLARNRLKKVIVAGKVESVSVFAAEPGAVIPDVSSLGAAAVTFTKSDTAETLEEENGTNVQGSAFAFRVDLGINGTVQKIVGRGLPRGE